jgi:DNA topoisomerase-1
MSYYKRKIKEKSKNYEYYTIDNKKIENKNILNKIKKIYIPPAYKNVKIYLKKDLLATGINSIGRKQYIYSDYSKQKREFKKYNMLIHLSKNINKLKNKMKKDLLLKDFTKNKLIALILKIMDLCNFRSGSKKYEKKYGSFGLTTLHKDHIKITNSYVEIDFIGKKGVNNNCIIKNKNIQELIKKIYNLSSKDNTYLFSIIYNNEKINVSISDVNNYLEEFNITVKELRTWNANIILLKKFKNEIEKLDDSYYKLNDNKKLKIIKKIIKKSIEKCALLLHHTPTICKSSYIYKKILENIENNYENIINKITGKKVIWEKILENIIK